MGPSEGKFKLFQCIIKRTLCHEGVWRSGGIAPSLLTAGLDEGGRSASRYSRFAQSVHLSIHTITPHRFSWRSTYLVKYMEKFTFYLMCVYVLMYVYVYACMSNCKGGLTVLVELRIGIT
jgi:hypothetical protein